MNNSLIHNDFKGSFTQLFLGVRLEYVDHVCISPQYFISFCTVILLLILSLLLQVFIPCVLNHQWFLIIANCIQKRFDVLIPDYMTAEYQQLVNTVIYNYKCLFILAYPCCIRFNIRDFQPSYVPVPKQKFRYLRSEIIVII